jgi:type I restriction enzyme S subunit
MKTRFEICPLGECLDSLESGGRPKGGATTTGDIPSIGGEHLNDSGRFDLQSMKFIPRSFYLRMNSGKIKKGDILVVKDGATTGKTSFVNVDFPYADAAVNEHVFIVRTRPGILDSKYAFFFLHSETGKELILKDFRGSAQGGITRSFAGRIKIPLPPLPIQKQIAAILEKTDAAREKRRHANKLTEQFLQSAFLEMFGDPVTNPKGWEKSEVNSLCELVRGSSPRPKGDVRLFGGPVPRLMIEDITRDGLFVTPSVDSLTEKGSKQSRWMKAGEVVMAVSGAIGLPAILTIDACIHDGFVGFRSLSNRVDPIDFLFHLLLVRSSNAVRAPGAIWKNLNTDQVKKWAIPIPPLLLQEKFVALVQKVESLRAKQRESQKELENLFNSLMQRAFRGELV